MILLEIYETYLCLRVMKLFYFRFFEVHTVHKYDSNTTTSYAPTELRLNPIYIKTYVTSMYLVFMYIIPFSTLAIFNMLTWLEMRRALARRAQLSGT